MNLKPRALLLLFVLVFICAHILKTARAQDITITLDDFAPYDTDAPHDTPARINNKYTNLSCPAILEKTTAYGYSIIILHVADELRRGPMPAGLPGRPDAGREIRNSARPGFLSNWSTNEIMRNEMRSALSRRPVKTGVIRTEEVIAASFSGRKIPHENDTRIYMLPAQRNGRNVESFSVLTFIYNPPSAKSGAKNASPRLLAVVPVLIPQKTGISYKNNVIWALVEISEEGLVKSAALESHYAYAKPFFSQIQESLNQWRFAPGCEKGQPVAKKISVPLILLSESRWREDYRPIVERLKSRRQIESPDPENDDTSDNGSVKQPRLISLATGLVFPDAFKDTSISAHAHLSYVVTKEGKVRDARVISATHPLFGDALLDRVKLSRFEPALKDGKPVEIAQTRPFAMAMGPISDQSRRLEIDKKAQALLPERYRYDIAPALTKMTLPIFPHALLSKEKKGHASVAAVIDENGAVIKTLVKESSRPEFGKAFEASLHCYEFKPAMRNGRPVSTFVMYKHEFKRDDRSGFPPATLKLLALESKAPEKILEAAELDITPEPCTLESIKAVFPLPLKDRGITQGFAEVEFLVDADGRVHLPRVITATEPEFGYAAVQAISHAYFEQPTADGQPVIARLRREVHFHIPIKAEENRDM